MTRTRIQDGWTRPSQKTPVPNEKVTCCVNPLDRQSYFEAEYRGGYRFFNVETQKEEFAAWWKTNEGTM